ncbi:MAG: hypothetical protein PHV28_03550 [Kiritimatiellae bacterium]|nr:hypothetical protein [Kiritimatiellia bacterium]
MKTLFILFLTTAGLTCDAAAQIRRSPRNQAPFNTRMSAGNATARNGNSSLGVPTAPKETARDTVTRVVFMGPKKGWGFVKAESPYYSPQGKNLGTLPGGTCFKYSDVKASSKNPMLVSVIKRGEAWEGPYLLDCTETASFEGDPAKVYPEIVRNLGTYFTLSGKIAERKEALAEQASLANPCYATARATRQAYQESVAKAAKMAEEARTLTGARKLKADEALRAYMYEQVRLKAKADTAAAACKAWDKVHPADPAQLAADPGLQALEKERQAVRVTVATLIPADEP